MDWGHLTLGLIAGLVTATLTAPVGVSGAVFLSPVQMDVLMVPSPAVTPTNLLGVIRSDRAGSHWSTWMARPRRNAFVPTRPHRSKSRSNRSEGSIGASGSSQSEPYWGRTSASHQSIS